jgi:hypothetical protein
MVTAIIMAPPAIWHFVVGFISISNEVNFFGDSSFGRLAIYQS